jgi:hypothetical protein
MRFGGRLQLREDHGPGLDVILELDEEHLQIATGGEVLGTWGLDEVDATRIGDDRFALVVAGERLDFLTHDPLAVIDKGLPAIEAGRVRARRARRGRKKRKERRPAKPPETLQVAVEGELVVETAPQETVKEPVPAGGPGHAAVARPESTLIKTVRRAATPLFDRMPGREPIPADHPHAFQVHHLPGGLIRRVCGGCGSISIDVSD